MQGRAERARRPGRTGVAPAEGAPSAPGGDPASEPSVVLRPAPPPPGGSRPRVIGPGRRERAYLSRIASLKAQLETAALCERGAGRRMDRLEGDLERLAETVRRQRRTERRLLVLAGALARENALLRERLALPARGPLPFEASEALPPVHPRRRRRNRPPG